MPDLSESERAELARLANLFEDVDVAPRTAVSGEFAPVAPMLAETLDTPLDRVSETDWLAEPKYDGTRLIVEKFHDEVRAYTRRGIDRYSAIPTVHGALAKLPNGLILDGELTHLTPAGSSSFHPIHTAEETLDQRDLRTVYVVFDVLYDGENWCDRPLQERKDRVTALVESGDHLRSTPVRNTDFPGYFRDVTDAGEEGIMLKRRDSYYVPGVRSSQWLKVKRFTERDAIVVGFTDGRGRRADTFGSLVLSDGAQCIGRVGSGFTESELVGLRDRMSAVAERPYDETAVGAPYTPVEPFVITVKYQELTADGKLRAPVYVGPNPEKPLGDVQRVE